MSSLKRDTNNLPALQKLLQTWIVEMTTRAGSGHPTSSLSAVHAMSVLMFGREDSGDAFFHFDVDNPEGFRNDRLIFSKGHAAPLYYALWAAAGVLGEDELMTLRRFDSVLEGHPTRRFALTEVPTGSLGQGLSMGLGEALALRAQGSPAQVFVLLGDSEMAEGQVWEALSVAAYYKLDNLVAVVDVNRLGQRGETMLGHDTEAYRVRAEAFGWHAIVVDGHNNAELESAYAEATSISGQPTMIITQTQKGYGISFLADQEGWHGKTLNKEELDRAVGELGDVDRSMRGTLAHPKTCMMREEDAQVQHQCSCGNCAQKSCHDGLVAPPQYIVGEGVAPRVAYGDVVAVLAQMNKCVVALDAETSNSTKAESVKKVAPEQFYEMFIAEQNMVSVAVGMARRGLRPFVSTFAAFLMRAADQIRMAQYADVDVTFVGSHCGVSIGPDGASQMGLQDMALFSSLRESVVLYPSDATSAYKLVVLAYKTSGLSYVRMTRAELPVLYDTQTVFRIGGSKVVRQSNEDIVTIVAVGIAVHESCRAADILRERGISVAVIDCYSVRPLDSDTVRSLAQKTRRVVIVEDHYSVGGLGSAVYEALSGEAVDIMHLCVRDVPRSGTSHELLEYEGISTGAIVQTILGWV